MKRIISWTIRQIIIVSLLAYGLPLGGGHQWAYNIAVFIIVISWPLYSLCWISMVLLEIRGEIGKVEEILLKVKNKVPAWMDLSVDLGILVLLAAYGHFIIATIQVFQIMAYWAIKSYTISDKSKESYESNRH